jgi:Tol biopolymer transport system component
MKRKDFLGRAAGAAVSMLLVFVIALAVASCASSPPLKPPGQGPWRFLTRDSSFEDGRPVFSPDGKHVLFMRSPANDQNVSTFWIVPSEGGEAKLFYSGEQHKPEPLQATRPDWSRKRRSFEIAFTGTGTDDSGLWLLDARTKEVKKVPLPVGSDGGKNIWS